MGFMQIQGLTKPAVKRATLPVGIEQESKPIILICDVPFTPTTKNVFEQCLHIAGLTWSDLAFINIFEDKKAIAQVYDRKKKKFIIDVQSYKDYLYQRLQKLKGNVIVTLGDAALAIVTDKRGSYVWRGSILDYTFTNSAKKLVPTLHPSYAIAAYLDRYKIIADFRRARNESKFPELVRPKRSFKLAPSLHEALAYLKSIQGRVSFDIECNGALETSCIAFAKSPSDCMCIPFYKAYWSETDEVIIWKAIANVLENPSIEKIGQNLMFDIAFLLKKNAIVTRGNIQDTMIAQALLYPEFPKGLDFLCSMYTDEPYYKDEGKIWKNPNADAMTFWRYNAKDAATTFEIWEVLHEQIDTRGYADTYKRTINLFNPLLFMQHYGIKADLVALGKTKAIVEQEIEDTQVMLNDMCGKSLNVNSSKACQTYFYVEKGIKPYFNKGRITTDNKAMQRIARLGFPEATLVQKIRGLRKLKGTYLDIKFDPDRRLRCSYNPVGTVTGRLSSRQTIFGTGTNFQNIPKQVREFLVADIGSILIEVDKVQAEWIGTAYISNDANMIEVVEKKMDAHVRTASLMFDVAPDQVTIELRKKGKVCNHSLNYDMGYRGFALHWGFKEKEAKDLVAKYHHAYPGIRLWHERVRNQLSTDRTLFNCFGRPRRFLQRWGDALFKSAYAYNPQSTIAEIVNMAMVDIYRNKLLTKLYLIGQVHDSLLGQQSYENIPQLIFMIRKVTEYLDRPIPCNGSFFTIPTEIKVGFNWKDMITLSTRDYNWAQIQTDLALFINDEGKKYVKAIK